MIARRYSPGLFHHFGVTFPLTLEDFRTRSQTVRMPAVSLEYLEIHQSCISWEGHLDIERARSSPTVTG